MRIGKRVHFNRGWLAGWPAGWQLQVGRGEHGHTYIHLGQEEGGEEEVAVVVVEEEMEEDFFGAKVVGCNTRKLIVTGKKTRERELIATRIVLSVFVLFTASCFVP